jgi:microcystin-dependent protein
VAEPFLSEISIMSFQFAPNGWALCNGQLLPINQNQGLFSLVGTTYGGTEVELRAPRHPGARR